MTIKINTKEIDSTEVGQSVEINGVITNIKEVDTTGKNWNMTKITIEDLRGKLAFIIWKTADDISQMMQVGNLCRIRGVIDEYKKQKQFKFNCVEVLTETEENRKLYDPFYYKSLDDSQVELFLKVIRQGFEDERYKRLAEIFFGLGEVPGVVDKEEYQGRFDKFKEGFCSISYHDNYAGGLLVHTLGMALMCINVKSMYLRNSKFRKEKSSEIKWDVVLLSILAHDYGKMRDYVPQGLTCNFNTEIKLGHEFHGVIEVEMKYRELGTEIPFADLENVKHCIMAHHGSYGGVEPKTPEAKIVHCIDCLDSTIVNSMSII